MAVATVYPVGWLLTLSLIQEKAWQEAFFWQKLKLLKALTSYFRDKGVGWWEQAFVKDWRNGTNEYA